MKIHSLSSVVVLASCICVTASCHLSSVGSPSDSDAHLSAPSVSDADSIDMPVGPRVLTLAFTGDILMGTNLPDSSYITKDRGRSLFEDCDSILRAADVAIGNLEGTCYYGTKAEITKHVGDGKCFVFRMPGDHAQRLVEAGLDAVGIANNHAGDCGPTGLRLTKENLRSVGLLYSGQKGGAEEAIIERDGVRYGFLAFAASCRNTLDLNNPAERDEYIERMRPKCDILIVTFHGGAEGTGAAHVPCKPETFYGENRGDVHKFAHECIDHGADIVVGHGPHVPRAMELYKGHLIAYSLGNFCAPFCMGTTGATGYAPLLCAHLNAEDGTFVGGKIYSYKQVKGVGPRRDVTNGAARNIAMLTQQDFPNSGLMIAEDGVIEKSE